eukprot:1238245-Amphidinium_carterae.2
MGEVSCPQNDHVPFKSKTFTSVLHRDLLNNCSIPRQAACGVCLLVLRTPNKEDSTTNMATIDQG